VRTGCWTPPTRWSGRSTSMGAPHVSESEHVVPERVVPGYVVTLFVICAQWYRDKYYGKQISNIKTKSLPMYIYNTIAHKLHFYYSYIHPSQPQPNAVETAARV
jgi:hypothetical protein